YLEKRGIDETMINEFQIGYCPQDNKIYQNLRARNYSDEDMIRLNVARMGSNGMNDVFYRRIVFPIHNKDGEPVAFTARDFSGFSESKYINSSETLIYTKGNILYNYHRAKDSARQSGNVIVTEGVMDVIAYRRAAINNVVATLGTACTAEQVRQLKDMAKTVILSYDGDRAGKAANMKIGEILLKSGVNVEVIDNDTGLDPDEIISVHGKNALRDLSARRLSYIDYAIKYYKDIYNLDNYADRKAMTLKVSALIDQLSDAYDIENYTNELYEITRIRKIGNEVKGKNEYNIVGKVANRISLDGLTKAEYTILTMMSFSKKAKDIYQKDLGYLLSEDSNRAANLIIDEYRKNGECQLARLYDEVEDQSIKDLIADLATVESLPEKFDEEVLRGSIERVKEEIKKRRLEDLKRLISKNQTIDPGKTNEYLEEYTELLKELGGK
ncbi:MAG: toprim domain-containing protein, partial [Erysipelotrichaceae bacterium]|nr:toprim domain-containing protein [Erysipelotrichaceae bacterium]